MLIGLILTYIVIGVLLATALLCTPEASKDNLDRVMCCLALPLWPLYVAIAAGFGIHDEVKRRRVQREWDRKVQYRKMLHLLRLLKLMSQ